MKDCESCKEVTKTCLDTGRFAFSRLYGDEKTMNVHIHDCCEIYYAVSGGKQFLIDGKCYDINDGDIFFINQFESHYLSQVEREIHERIVVAVHPEYLKQLSTQQTDLGSCFYTDDQVKANRVHLSEEEQKRFIYFIHKLRKNEGFGEDILDQAIFQELLVFLNQIYANERNRNLIENKNQSHDEKVDQILTYINQNIREDLSTTNLADYFYLSNSYLCRIFKAATGTTINKYITAKRITISKELLSAGYPVNEVCEQCGFRDYSNYLKAFRKAVGITPKKYAQFL